MTTIFCTISFEIVKGHHVTDHSKERKKSKSTIQDRTMASPLDTIGLRRAGNGVNLNILTSLFKRAPSIRDVQTNREDIEFFASLESSNQDLAFLSRDQVETSPLPLSKQEGGGDGNFHQVFAVTGFSSDFKAKLDKQRRYELKTLKRPEDFRSKKEMVKAIRELINDAKYLKLLNSKNKNSGHPNILKLHGITLDAYGHCLLAGDFRDFFLLTDRVQETLAQRIHQWRFATGRGNDPDEDMIPMKGNYAYQLAKALKHCHDHGVLFRGLQPTRIAFSSSPEEQHVLQLIDFGLARDFPPLPPRSVSTASTCTASESDSDAPSPSDTDDNKSYKMTLAGTRRYIAGEVLATGHYTWKSDVYSWAMCWYEMLTERKPYIGLSAAEHQTYVCERGDRPNLADYYFPEEVDDILVAAWDPDVSKRLTMEQVCDKMQSFLMNLDIHYYEQKEGEFLFDVEVMEDDVSEIGEDEWLTSTPHNSKPEDRQQLCGNDSDELLSRQSLDDSSSLSTAEALSTSSDAPNNILVTSWKSFESGTKRTIASVESGKPRKIISEAA